MSNRTITPMEALNYEVRSSLFAPWISWAPLQELASRYFAWKANRKWRRYAANLAMAEELKDLMAAVKLTQ